MSRATPAKSTSVQPQNALGLYLKQMGSVKGLTWAEAQYIASQRDQAHGLAEIRCALIAHRLNSQKFQIGHKGQKIVQPKVGNQRHPITAVNVLEALRPTIQRASEPRIPGVPSKMWRRVPRRLLDNARHYLKESDRYRDRLAASVAPAVVKEAKKYAHGDTQLMLDLIQDGNLQALRAAQLYAVGEEANFHSYVIKGLRNRVLRGIRQNAPVSRRPSVKDAAERFRDQADRMTQEQGRRPTVFEVAAKVGVSEPKADRYIRQLSVISKARQNQAEVFAERNTLHEIPNYRRSGPELRLHRRDTRAAITRILQNMPTMQPRWLRVMIERYRLEDLNADEVVSSEVVSQRLGSRRRQAVTSVENTVTKHIKKDLQAYGRLRAILEAL